MNSPKENPLTPDSLAADGIQGASAKASGPSGVENTPQTTTARILALAAINAAREQFEAYALATDNPEYFMILAADCLDEAHAWLMHGGEQ